jgi:hypothetical protein
MKDDTMIEKIKESINDPVMLEQLYRSDSKTFESDFEKVYPSLGSSDLAKFWKIRLESDNSGFRLKKLHFPEILKMILACLAAGFLIRLPVIFNLGISDSLFYERNAGIIVFLGLTIYCIAARKYNTLKHIGFILLLFLIPAIYINLLHPEGNGDSVKLAYIHLPLLMWFIYGLIFINFELKEKTKRIDYIKYNGDLAVVLALIAAAGGILTAITIGLFDAIGISIGKFYMENIVVIGLVSAPILATFIIDNYLPLTNKIAPLIANIFSPLVLLTLVVYLIFFAFSGKDPYNDREFLLIFNIMLLGVMGIIIFSVTGISNVSRQKFNGLILLILSITAIIINVIALSAIFYRLGRYGISPNKLAVLVSNLLIFINLIWITIDLFHVNLRKADIKRVEMNISRFLPVYLIWILIVVFCFPLFFGMN